MTEAVMERVEVEAGVEEIFGFLSDLENVCALVRMTEQSRRVDLSESRWSFRSPAGMSVEVGPDAFHGCLRRERLGESLGGRAGEEMANPSSPDLVLGDVFIDFKTLSSRKTLLSLTYHWADLTQTAGRAADEGLAGSFAHWTRMRGGVNLDLRALIEDLLATSWREGGTPPHLSPRSPPEAADASAGSVGGFPANAVTDEDRAWLEGDLSRLGEYGSYELTEEQLAEEKPIRYVPGLGLVVEDQDDGSAG